MTIASGTRLGPYEIGAPLGAGGMGEVYRANDTRLERAVAVKVLPGHLSGSAEVRQRFEREARAISSLSHPNICTLFDVGREGDTDFLVMELLEGESLAQRLERGPLPIDEVLRHGIQIADALERAHANGVIHRDLKPGNVFLTERGVKLLDFGLAKLHAAPAGSGGGGAASKFDSLPTELASAPLTTAGTILGTFQYMAPEQLEGKDADARTDIFSLGAVLYEMATGRRAFSGSSQASLIGAIMGSTPPPVSSIAPLTPPAFDRLVATCLAKQPRDRWHTAHDVRLQLSWIAEGGSQLGVPAPVAHRRLHRERLAWGLAAGFAALAALATAGYLARAPQTPPSMRFEIQPPASISGLGAPKVSPDGRHIAFSGRDEQGRLRLWLRSLDSLEIRPLAGTEGVAVNSRPFWSPDSQQVAFFTLDRLMKVRIDGSPPQKIADTSGADGTWTDRGVILYDGGANDPIRRVDASGGTPEPAVPAKTGPGGYAVGWPQALPGSHRFLYMVLQGPESENGIWVGDLDGEPGRRLFADASRVEFSPPGHLLYVRDDTMMAQPFDPRAGELAGEPMPIVQGLDVDLTGGAQFSVSANGVLVFRTEDREESQFVWIGRGEGRLGDPVARGILGGFDLSPDERWLAFGQRDRDSSNIWLRDLKRGVSSPFTTGEGFDLAPIFAPDGDAVIYEHRVDRASTIVRRPLDGGPDAILHRCEGVCQARAITPDGRLLVLAFPPGDGQATWDLKLVDLAGPEPRSPRPLVGGQANESRAGLSPDTRWLVYSSDESGRAEVYVQSFPDAGRRWQISTAGGDHPAWSADGSEIFFLSPDRQLMRVAVVRQPTFDAGQPERLSSETLSNVQVRSLFAATRDGRRFLVHRAIDGRGPNPITVVLGWDAALRR